MICVNVYGEREQTTGNRQQGTGIVTTVRSDESIGTESAAAAFPVPLECVSKCREMQFRGHQVAFQGEKPQAYWLQVKVFQHRNAA